MKKVTPTFSDFNFSSRILIFVSYSSIRFSCSSANFFDDEFRFSCGKKSETKRNNVVLIKLIDL